MFTTIDAQDFSDQISVEFSLIFHSEMRRVQRGSFFRKYSDALKLIKDDRNVYFHIENRRSSEENIAKRPLVENIWNCAVQYLRKEMWSCVKLKNITTVRSLCKMITIIVEHEK